VRQSRQVREEGLCAAEDAGREGGASAPSQDRRQADRTAQGPGRLYRRQAGRPVQVGPLSVLSCSALSPTLILSAIASRSRNSCQKKGGRPREGGDPYPQA